MNITIFGTGYVGLVTGACFSEVGHHVMCVDIDAGKIKNLQNGNVPVFEPGLESLVTKNTARNRLQFRTSIEEGVNHSDIQIIAVGTPPDEDGSADLQHVISVAESIGTFMQTAKLVINKSTVPVGTADLVMATIRDTLKSRECDFSFNVISNPEFLKEGSAVNDFMKPDRIIIGSNDEHSEVYDIMHELYAPFNRNRDKLMFMDIRSAELTKYAANAMLATKISFMNEIANLAEILGADIENVRHGIGSDPRIGYEFIYPGCGYGGSCFPKDVKALCNTARNNGYQSTLLESVEEVNNRQKTILYRLIKQHFGDTSLKDMTFALWGLSFKPKTDDMREAPSRCVMEALWEEGASIQAYDPKAMSQTSQIYQGQHRLTLVETAQQALEDADALIICTEWAEFRAPDFAEITELLKNPLIFDGRNLYDPQLLKEKGIQYYAIGRGDSVSRSSK